MFWFISELSLGLHQKVFGVCVNDGNFKPVLIVYNLLHDILNFYF